MHFNLIKSMFHYYFLHCVLKLTKLSLIKINWRFVYTFVHLNPNDKLIKQTLSRQTNSLPVKCPHFIPAWQRAISEGAIRCHYSQHFPVSGITTPIWNCAQNKLRTKNIPLPRKTPRVARPWPAFFVPR